MKNISDGVILIATALIGVAIVAVLVSQKANTSNVIKALTGGFASDLQAAVSPVSGGTTGLGGISSFGLD